MGGSLSSLSATDEDAEWLALPLRATLNDTFTASAAKTLPSCVSAEDGGGGGNKAGPVPGDASFQLLRALGELLSHTEDEKSVKASPLVRPVCGNPM